MIQFQIEFVLGTKIIICLNFRISESVNWLNYIGFFDALRIEFEEKISFCRISIYIEAGLYCSKYKDIEIMLYNVISLSQ